MVQISHPYMTTGKIIALTVQTFVRKVVSLLLSTLSRFVIAFLPRSKRLLISWLQSPSTVIYFELVLQTWSLSRISLFTRNMVGCCANSDIRDTFLRSLEKLVSSLICDLVPASSWPHFLFVSVASFSILIRLTLPTPILLSFLQLVWLCLGKQEHLPCWILPGAPAPTHCNQAPFYLIQCYKSGKGNHHHFTYTSF